MVPFTDKVTTTKPIKVKVDGGIVDMDYATTTNRKCKIKFDAPETGLVYVKWIPHCDNTYLNNDWKVTLDLQSSNEYTYTT